MNALNAVPWDHSIDQALLNIDNRVRTNLFPWNGQFSPQLVEALLKQYSSRTDTVLDPFMGSGTVLVESARLGTKAIGTEINPAAYKMARVYHFINIRPRDRKLLIDQLHEYLHAAFPDNFFIPAASASPEDEDSVKRRLIDVVSNARDELRILGEALVVLVDFQKPVVDTSRVFGQWRSLCRKVLNLPFCSRPIDVVNCDARDLPLITNHIDLVITSPPYINVFNYHQKFRCSVEALGWDLLEVAKSEIGSNRKHRGNRFLTVIQYCLDMAAVFEELKRVCKADSRIIVVLGRESQVRKTPFFNGDIAVRIATECVGLRPAYRQERVFTNRFGARIFEDIVHFTQGMNDVGRSPRKVGLEILESARSSAPAESLDDLSCAIAQAEAVGESPLYRPGECRDVGSAGSRIANATS